MRRFTLRMLAAVLIMAALPSHGSGPRVMKVLPMFLDHKGRHMLSPSLYERDAYQAYLRDHPELQSGRLFSVQWKAPGKRPLLLRLELRGIASGTMPRRLTIEKFVQPRGWFTNWDELLLVGDDYTGFGEITAWRLTLWDQTGWEDETLLAEQHSFLW